MSCCTFLIRARIVCNVTSNLHRQNSSIDQTGWKNPQEWKQLKAKTPQLLFWVVSFFWGGGGGGGGAKNDNKKV